MFTIKTREFQYISHDRPMGNVKTDVNLTDAAVLNVYKILYIQGVSQKIEYFKI